ncbi:MAG TPA: Gfo/Idh/MocA family oxidoreductase [Flavobacteriaceae bacterium]|jgi:predicted dehydrogenase|nr:Gfo/Idh/MocA family oxidoreductase [Flavobacteriaceae bacterium]HJO70271.1 Gfo/Idh/MocA family oxidoreductase [Flavobacteriaceae bacterium]
MSKKIRLGILGGGGDSLVGILHRIATSMHNKYQIVGGVFNPNFDDNIKFAKEIGLNENRIYEDFEKMIEEELKLDSDKRMEVISILTPNFLHYPMAKRLLENNFNVICEKPMTTSYEEAKELDRINKEKQLVFAVTYTYTGYPMVRQMKNMIESGEIGDIQKVDLQYYQGWINPIIHDDKKRAETWRLQPDKSGISCCIGDIGTHAFDMLEYVSGMQVNQILADLNYIYPENKMDVDGTILIKFSENIKGVIRASQIATGEENNFSVAIYGKKGSLKWEQENPNYLYHLSEDSPLKVLKPGHEYNSDFSLAASKLPPGHPEGVFDSMANIYNGIANKINNKNSFNDEYPTLNDGLRGMLFIEKAVESHSKGNIWVKLNSN